MNIDFEKLPSHFFDRIEHKSFEELNTSEQQEVLLIMDSGEYNEFHQAAKGMARVSADSKQIWYLPRKELLLSEFDRIYPVKTKWMLGNSGSLLWQAAAVMFFILASWFFYGWMTASIAPPEAKLALVDTVYIQKPEKATTQIVNDTVFVDRYVSGNTTQRTTPITTAHSSGSPQYTISENESVYVIPVSEINADHNSNKGNSMQFDTLFRKFVVVSL